MSESPEAYNFIKKETPTQVFSCKFWKIIKTRFFIEPLADSVSWNVILLLKNTYSGQIMKKSVTLMVDFYGAL